MELFMPFYGMNDHLAGRKPLCRIKIVLVGDAWLLRLSSRRFGRGMPDEQTETFPEVPECLHSLITKSFPFCSFFSSPSQLPLKTPALTRHIFPVES